MLWVFDRRLASESLVLCWASSMRFITHRQCSIQKPCAPQKSRKAVSNDMKHLEESPSALVEALSKEDLTKLTVSQLKDLLKEKGLKAEMLLLGFA